MAGWSAVPSRGRKLGRPPFVAARRGNRSAIACLSPRGRREAGDTCDACIRRDAIIGRFARPRGFRSVFLPSPRARASLPRAPDSLTDALRNQPRGNRARIIYPSPLSRLGFRRFLAAPSASDRNFFLTSARRPFPGCESGTEIVRERRER